VSVTLYEPALRALLESQEGPVGRYIQTLAVRVVARAEDNFDEYFAAANLPDMENVGYSMDGSSATIGYKDVGNKSRRLARAEAEGKLRNPPIQSALQSVRG
jgi:hypothetical protein